MSITPKIMFIIIIIHLFTEIASNSHLAIFRQPYYPEESFYKKTPHYHSGFRKLLCISDKPKDAIVWNTHLNWADKQLINSDRVELEDSQLSSYVRNDQQCKIDVDSSHCFSKWTQYGIWSLAHSFKVPMGPVFDDRWEHFADYRSEEYQEVEFPYLNGIKSKGPFDTTGALAFSIRGSPRVDLLLCASKNFRGDLCYRLTIKRKINRGGSYISLKECRRGIPLNGSIDEDDSICWSVKGDSIESDLLSYYEWKTFVLTWDDEKRTIELFNSNELILTYHDDLNTLSFRNFDHFVNMEFSHVFYRSPDQGMLVRFHNYSYVLTKQPGVILNSPPLKMENYQEICIDMLIGLCKGCNLVVNLVDGSGKRRVTKTIVRSPVYEHVQHELPMWQQERITSSNITGYLTPITLELITVSSDTSYKIGDHWAITKFEECLPEGTVKRVKMIAVKDYNDGKYFWPTVTCQRLSYDNPQSETLNATSHVFAPPNDFSSCPEFHIGPNCATPCGLYFNGDCSSVTMCDRNGCFCTPGYEGSDCRSKCVSWSYGYSCTKSCGHCDDYRCNRFTGKCAFGCQIFQDEYYLPPYCDIVHYESKTLRHEYWAIPFALLLVAVIGIALYYYRKVRV